MPITLDLVRHGEALAAAGAGDHARRLSPRGMVLVRRLGRHLGEIGWRPGDVFTSPLVRARETAALLLEAARVTVEPVVLDELAPDAEPADLLVALDAYGLTSGHALLVGHQPLMGDLIAYLTRLPAQPLHTSELVRLEFPHALGARDARASLSIRPERLG